MDFREKLKHILGQLKVESPEVNLEPGNGYRVVAEVISPSFEKMADGDRQRLVWSKLLDELDDDEQAAIDTIFTNSPSEHQAGLTSLATEMES